MSVTPVQGRFALLDKPFANPGKCAVCGSSNKPVVDFNFNLDWYGAVYFCVECLAEVGRVIDLVPRKESLNLERESTESILKYCDDNGLVLLTEEYYGKLVNTISSIKSAFDSIPEWNRHHMEAGKLHDRFFEDNSARDDQLPIDFAIEDNINTSDEGPDSVSSSARAAFDFSN